MGSSQYNDGDKVLNLNDPKLWQPLDKSRQEIRLIRFNPNYSLDSLIRLSSFSVSLIDSPKPLFNALSYAWGNASKTMPICIDGKVVQVTTNLESALRHIWTSENTSELIKLPLWIDAICINQQDLEERNHQVGIMRRIYVEAHHVLVWLGQGDEETDWLFDLCERRKWQYVTPSLNPPYESDGIFLQQFADTMKAAEVLERKVLNRPWWKRVWVVQEFVLASQDPVIVCGCRSTSWSNFDQTFQQASAHMQNRTQRSAVLERAEGPLDGPRCLSILRQDYQNTGGLDCSTIILIAERCKATQPHDYFYGCAALLKPIFSSSIPVQYDQSPLRVFHQLTILLLRLRPNLILEDTIGLSALCHGDPNFPTWVSDLSKLHESKTYRELSCLGDRSSSRFRNNKRCWRAPDINISEQEVMIQIRGIEIDIVGEVHLVETILKPQSTAERAEVHKQKMDEQELSALFQIISMAERKSHLQLSESHRLFHIERLRYEQSLTNMLLSHPGIHVTYPSSRPEWNALKASLLAGEQEATTPQEEPWKLICRALQERALITSNSGFAGISTANAMKGDTIVFLFGMDAPLILRKRQSQDGYVVVGRAMVAGMTNLRNMEKYYEDGLFKGLDKVFNIY
jgi:hypothetical protein